MSPRPTLVRGDIVRARGCTETDPGTSIDDLLVTSPPDPSGLVMLAARTPEGVFDAGSPFIGRADELRRVRGPAQQMHHATIIPEAFARQELAGLGALVDALEAGPAGEDWTREDLETLAFETLEKIAGLIRLGRPIALPDLGTFFRAPKTGNHGAPTVRFIPSPELLSGGRRDA